MKIEDNLSNQTNCYFKPNELLDFINKERYGFIGNESDLHQWLCKAIENIKEDIEKRGEQVQGYWNEWVDSEGKNRRKPKTEPECQNILWPIVKQHLKNLEIVNIEEKWIASDRADLFVVSPRKSEKYDLQVCIELKTAREGYSAAKLIDPLEEQLVKTYLLPSGSRHGIYIVLWFKDKDAYPFPVAWNTKAEFEKELEKKRIEAAEKYKMTLFFYVIDMTTPVRKH